MFLPYFLPPLLLFVIFLSANPTNRIKDLGSDDSLSRQSSGSTNYTACDRLAKDIGKDYLGSTAGDFLFNWTLRHRATKSYQEKRNFPQAFVDSSVMGHLDINCAVDTGCTRLPSCADLVDALREPRTDEHLQNVYYNIQAISDWYDVVKASVYPNVENSLQGKLSSIVEDFSWPYNPEIPKECEKREEEMEGLIQGAILFGFLSAGDGMGAGLVPKGGYSAFTNIAAAGATIVNTYVTTELDLKEKYCSNKPNPDEKQEEERIEDAAKLLSDHMFKAREVLVNTTISLREDSMLLQQELNYSKPRNNRGLSLPELVWTGRTILNNTQRRSLAHLEKLEKGLTDILTREMIMWVMRQELSGVFCGRDPTGHCEEDNLDFYDICVIPNEGIHCRGAAWMKWNKNPNLIPLWGFEKMVDGVYGWTYRDLVVRSFENWRDNGLFSDAITLRGKTNRYIHQGTFDPLSNLHIPVCADLDGIFPLPIVGGKPGTDLDDYDHLKGDSKSFGCSCGVGGWETRRFFDRMGIYGTPWFKDIYDLCMAESARRINQANPVTHFLSLCNLVGSYVYSKNAFDPDCIDIEHEYYHLKSRHDVTSKSAACYIVAYSKRWADMIKRDHTAHTKFDMGDWGRKWYTDNAEVDCAQERLKDYKDESWKDFDLSDGTQNPMMSCTSFIYEGDERGPNVLAEMFKISQYIDDSDEYSDHRYIAVASGKAEFSSGDLLDVTYAMYGTNGDAGLEEGRWVGKAFYGRDIKESIKTAAYNCDGNGVKMTFNYPHPHYPYKALLIVEMVKSGRGCGDGSPRTGPALCLHGSTYGSWDFHPWKHSFSPKLDLDIPKHRRPRDEDTTGPPLQSPANATRFPTKIHIEKVGLNPPTVAGRDKNRAAAPLSVSATVGDGAVPVKNPRDFATESSDSVEKAAGIRLDE